MLYIYGQYIFTLQAQKKLLKCIDEHKEDLIYLPKTSREFMVIEKSRMYLKSVSYYIILSFYEYFIS